MNPRVLVAVGLALGAAVAARPAAACAGCSNPNLPTTRNESIALAPGEVSAALNVTATTLRVVHSESCPDIGPVCLDRNEPPQQHDQRFYVGELRPVVAVGITSNLGAELQLPLRLVNTTITFRRQDGTAFEPDYENIHHRNETLSGVADPWLLGRVTGSLDRVALTGRAGIGLPLGSTEEDPFARGRAGLAHQHIQFGTGTFYPVLAIDAVFDAEPVRVSTYAQTLLFLYDNSEGYRAGNRYMAGLAGDVEVLTSWRAGLGADILNEQPERWNGVVQQDGNVGRTDVLVGATLNYRASALTLSLSVKTPVYQHFLESHEHDEDPGQLTYPVILGLSVQTNFGGQSAPSPGAPP